MSLYFYKPLVAALVDELGLVELSDQLLGTHKLQPISPGQVLKAMILNGLGFVSAPLYLFREFFEGKPVEHLLGPGIKAEHLNDDRLGRVLDALFEYGTTAFFLQVAMQAVEVFSVSLERRHLDSTSFALDGEYAQMGEEEPQAIEICRGYSRDHRPELKQFLVNLICSADGGIPLRFKVGSGNETDSQTFAGQMCAFARQWQAPCHLQGYQLWQQRQNYAGIEQRWMLKVRSVPSSRGGSGHLRSRRTPCSANCGSSAPRSLPASPMPQRPYYASRRACTGTAWLKSHCCQLPPSALPVVLSVCSAGDTSPRFSVASYPEAQT